MFALQVRCIQQMNHTQDTKVIVIGGISGGIGSALAKLCLHSGHTVAGFSRTAKEDATPIESVDATDAKAVENYIAKVHTEYGRIDAYVHAIGSIYLKPGHLTSDDDWLQTIQTNLSSAFYALRACTKRMQKQGQALACFSARLRHKSASPTTRPSPQQKAASRRWSAPLLPPMRHVACASTQSPPA